MKEYCYTPKNLGWSGHVKVKVPTYRERLKMAQQMGLNNLGGEDVSAQIGGAIALLDKIAEHIVEVSLVWDNEEYKSLEEIEYFKEGTELVNELGILLIQGISLGKS